LDGDINIDEELDRYLRNTDIPIPSTQHDTDIPYPLTQRVNQNSSNSDLARIDDSDAPKLTDAATSSPIPTRPIAIPDKPKRIESRPMELDWDSMNMKENINPRTSPSDAASLRRKKAFDFFTAPLKVKSREFLVPFLGSQRPIKSLISILFQHPTRT
jgi:hypothetical protein